MIEIERLKNVHHVVVHRDAQRMCPDGVASAIILRDVLTPETISFVAHGRELDALMPEAGMLFCDIAPKPEHAEKFLAVDAIVLDHHKSTKETVARFAERGLGVFADEEKEPGVSGAVLAWREVWKPLAFRGAQRPGNHEREGRGGAHCAEFARLVGIRDTYQRESPDWKEACELSAALAFWPWTAWPHDVFHYRDGRVTIDGYSHTMRMCLDAGETLFARHLDECRKLIDEGLRFVTPSGTRGLIISTRDTTDVADMLGREHGTSADIVMGFGFQMRGDWPTMIVSTRSRGTFDCASFAKSLGGGGHTNAAGYQIELAGTSPHPYVMLREQLLHWESRKTNR